MAGGNGGPDLSYSDPVHVDRVAADFPALPIVVSHGGWPWVHQILHVAYRRQNVHVSPDMYLDLLLPAHRRLFDWARAHALPVILHSDGFVEPLIPALVDAGFDGLQCLESAAGVVAGGRSGVTAVVCGLLFIGAMFVAPMFGVIPSQATAPACTSSRAAIIRCCTTTSTIHRATAPRSRGSSSRR